MTYTHHHFLELHETAGDISQTLDRLSYLKAKTSKPEIGDSLTKSLEQAQSHIYEISEQILDSCFLDLSSETDKLDNDDLDVIDILKLMVPDVLTDGWTDGLFRVDMVANDGENIEVETNSEMATWLMCALYTVSTEHLAAARSYESYD